MVVLFLKWSDRKVVALFSVEWSESGFSGGQFGGLFSNGLALG